MVYNSGKKGKILVIDDDFVVLNLIKEALIEEGFQVTTFQTAREALSEVNTILPDLVLLDILMPAIDGWETCKRLKAEDSTKEIPIIFLSAIQDTEDKVKAFEAGGVDYIVKPINTAELLARVNTHISLFFLQRQLHESNRVLEQKVKRSLREIQESNERYKTVADFTYDWEYWMLPDGKLEYVSPSCEHITGYSREDFIAHPKLISDIIHQEDKHIWAKHTRDFTEDNSIHPELLFRIETKNGEIRWISHYCKPVYTSTGEYRGRRSSNRDVTSNQQINKRVQNILQGTNAGTYDWDIESGELILNERWAEIIGYTLDELEPISYNTWADNVHPDDLKLAVTEIEKVRNKELDFYDVTFRMKHKKGEWVWINARGAVTEWSRNGKPLRMSGTHLDITRLVMARKTIRAKEERFKKFYELGLVGMNISSIEKKMLDFNDRFCNMLGYSRYDLSRLKWTDITHPDDIEQELVLFEKVLKGVMDGYKYQKRIIHKTGRDIHIEKSTSIVRNAEGNVDYFVSIIHDITDRINYEIQVEEKNIELKTLNDQLKKTNEELIVSRKISEQNENNFRQLFDNMEQGFALHRMIYDKDGSAIDYEYLMVNESFGKLTGTLASEIVGKTVMELFPDTEKYWIGNFGNVAKEGTTLHFENYFQTTDSYYDVVAYSPLKDHFAVVFQNVTDRKKSEQSLLIDKAITDAFAKHTGDDIFHTLNDFLITHFNCDFGFIAFINSDGDLESPSLTRGIWDICKVEGKNSIFKKEDWGGMWGESLKKKKIVVKTENLKVPDGHIRLKNAVAVPILDKNNLIGQFVLGDWKQPISEHSILMLERISGLISPLLKAHLNEMAYKERILEAKNIAEKNEHRLNSIIENTQAGYFFIDLEGRYRKVNRAWLDLYGFDSFDDVIGKHYSKTQKLTDTEEAVEIFHWIIEQKEDYSQGEYNRVCLDGTVGYHTLSAVPVRDGDKIIGVEGFLIDTTDRKHMEQELIVAKERAEESDRLKSEFLRNMSHEIRTPMNGIMGFSEMLGKDDINDEKRSQYVNIIQSSCYQLMNVIDDILEISYLETKQIQPNIMEVNLNDLLMDQFSIFSLKAKEKGIQLYIDKGLPDEECTVYTDRVKLLKTFNNILENAFKFTSDGKVEFGYERDNDEILFFVKDTGLGIDAKNLESIFLRFSQENKDISGKVGGLGLGLSIARENIELLGGRIFVKSEKGVGSTFYFTIPFNPVMKEASGDEAKTNNALNKGLKTLKVLIAEDEDINFLYIEEVLKGVNTFYFNISHARDGLEALDLFINDDFDLVFMDIKMPVMDGYDSTRRMKELDPSVIVIAQTAYSSEEDKQKALSAGCDDFISKPISQESLINILNKFK